MPGACWEVSADSVNNKRAINNQSDRLLTVYVLPVIVIKAWVALTPTFGVESDQS